MDLLTAIEIVMGALMVGCAICIACFGRAAMRDPKEHKPAYHCTCGTIGNVNSECRYCGKVITPQ